MIKSVIAAAVILVIATSAASAQYRAGDAALGAVSGAIVLGPIGAVAGAFIGYSAGHPSLGRGGSIAPAPRGSEGKPRATACVTPARKP